MSRDWRAAMFFLLMLANSVCASAASTDIPICLVATADKLDSAGGLMNHCKDYCKDTSAVATSYGAPNVAVERLLVDSDLCQDGMNRNQNFDCAEPYIDQIEFLFAYLEKDTKVFSIVRKEREDLINIATSIGKTFQVAFTELMKGSASMETPELAQRSKTLSAEFNSAFEEQTKASRENLKRSIKRLSDAIRIKQEELVDLQQKLDSQLQNCTVMTNAKPVKEVCRQRQGGSESNFCCCRTNGLAIYNPGNSGFKCTLPGEGAKQSDSAVAPAPKPAAPEVKSLSTAFQLQKPGVSLQFSFLVMFSIVVSF
mmetsp:Transcript_24568/g.39579  ORF Transcript_24568/g.39579 Transcript_24568/m.39579 type:complete len:312 (-) Transcript_24568:552-1487(-)